MKVQSHGQSLASLPYQDMIEGSRCDHQAGVDGAADDTAERVPRAIIEPVEADQNLREAALT